MTKSVAGIDGVRYRRYCLFCHTPVGGIGLPCEYHEICEICGYEAIPAIVHRGGKDLSMLNTVIVK